MDFAVTPGVAVGRAPAVVPTTAVTARAATISRNVFFMRFSPFAEWLGGMTLGPIIRGLDPKEKDRPCAGGTTAGPGCPGSGLRRPTAPRKAPAGAPPRRRRARIR